MEIAISIITLPFVYVINKFSKLNESINGNWFTYLKILYQFFVKRKFSKGRLELHNPDIDEDPRAVGLLPFQQEWDYECPNKSKAENVFIYGTNTSGQYLLINIKWRPQTDNLINASVNLIFKDQNGLVYELNESDSLQIRSNETLRKYKIAGLTLEVLCPFRKLRIKVRGYLRRNDTNELIYTRFRLFWSPLSNVFDFQNDFDDQFIAKEFSSLGISSVEMEDRHEQWGQITGTIQFENEQNSALFLWGNKSKQYITNDKKQRITRVYGFSSKGFAFHIGSFNSFDQIRYRYGYMSFGTGSVYPISSISTTFNELESIGTSLIKIILDIEPQNRKFDLEIEECCDRYKDILICDIKLNGHKGKCVVLHEKIDRHEKEDIESSFKLENDSKNVVSDLVLSISDPKSQNVLCSGGKGASLGALYELAKNSKTKFVVPRGLIVTSNSYQVLIENCPHIENAIKILENMTWSETREGVQQCCENVAQKFGQQKLPQIIKNQLRDNLKSIFGENFESLQFAVRSSASGEDSEEMSAAGQMNTYLGVKGIEEICSAVMKCWSSQFSFVAVEYKRGYGQEINSPMAVIIQEMINCDSAGVIFTCDPLTGDERKIIITGNYGIGESVVSAMAEPDTIRLDVNIEANSLQKQRTIKGIESIQIGSKLKAITLSNNNESGTIEINTANSKDCCLNESECLSLANISLEVHKYYGNPRDIEWGIKNKQIYLFQSRPITNLDNSWTEWEIMHDLDSGQQSEEEYLSRANLGEVFPGASSHMCLSWLINTWNSNGFRQFKNWFNLTNKEFSPFYNRGGGIVSNHYFFLLKTGSFPFVGDPKSIFSRSIQVGIFGHEFNDEELFNDSNEKENKRITSLYTKILFALRLIYYFLTPGISLRKAKEELKNLDFFEGKDSKTAKDVFKVISESYNLNIAATYAHGNVTMSSMMFNMILLNMLKTNNIDTEGDNSYTDFAQLLSCANEVVSAEVPNLLKEIANSIENRQIFREMSDEKALNFLINGDSKASIKFKQFLSEYGHRGYKEFDPLALQWDDNPITVVKSLKTMLTGNVNLTQSKQIKSIDKIISSLKTPLSFFKKFLLKYWIIPWCQSGVGLREQGKHFLTWTYNKYRHAFWRLAKLMVREGRLPEADLLFHVTFPELETLINERDPTIVARARLRKRFHSIKDNLKFNETSIGPNIKPRDELESIPNGVANGEIARIKGIPVSSGKVKARCCVAMTLEEAQNIKSGDILITYSTDIGWSPYFPMLSGLATEIGGLISHGAVIAREYGLPCLVGVEGASKLFKTGDVILIDSELGQIIKVE